MESNSSKFSTANSLRYNIINYMVVTQLLWLQTYNIKACP